MHADKTITVKLSGTRRFRLPQTFAINLPNQILAEREQVRHDLSDFHEAFQLCWFLKISVGS